MMKKNYNCGTIKRVILMKKLKLRKKNVLLYASFIFVAIILVFFLFQNYFKTDNKIVDNDSEVVDTNNVSVDMVEYNVYQLEELDFGFVIVKLRVKSDTPIDLPLSILKTSEGIILSDVDYYLNKMIEKSLFVGRKQVDFEIKSAETEILVNIFIPIKNTKLEQLTLTVLGLEDKIIEFDLTSNIKKNSSEFLYQTDDIITDGNNYSFIVRNAIEITGETLYNQGLEEGYPSTGELHVFHLEVTSLTDEALVIEDAKYVVNGTNTEIFALSGDYSTEKRDGIINVLIEDEYTGCLFFLTLNPEKLPITYTGDLYIKVKGIDYWIRIQVDL